MVDVDKITALMYPLQPTLTFPTDGTMSPTFSHQLLVVQASYGPFLLHLVVPHGYTCTPWLYTNCL